MTEIGLNPNKCFVVFYCVPTERVDLSILKWKYGEEKKQNRNIKLSSCMAAKQTASDNEKPAAPAVIVPHTQYNFIFCVSIIFISSSFGLTVHYSDLAEAFGE